MATFRCACRTRLSLPKPGARYRTHARARSSDLCRPFTLFRSCLTHKYTRVNRLRVVQQRHAIFPFRFRRPRKSAPNVPSLTKWNRKETTERTEKLHHHRSKLDRVGWDGTLNVCVVVCLITMRKRAAVDRIMLWHTPRRKHPRSGCISGSSSFSQQRAKEAFAIKYSYHVRDTPLPAGWPSERQ